MATAGAAQVFLGRLGGLRALAQPSVPVRRSLHGMALDDPDLDAYRTFVGMMQARDQSKPGSWLGFSLQHGAYNDGFKYCPHGDWYFLPWHREYVVMYESAVRSLTGHTGFAMPYWDWTVDRNFPTPFSDTTYKGKANPLYVSGRTLTGSNWPLSDSIVGPAVMKRIYGETDFQAFGTSKNPSQNNLDMSWVVAGGGVQGTLERTPHNNIHNFIGAYMPSAGSPRDPIFMMHHGNIDRIWAHWNGLGRSNLAGMSPSDQTLWLDMNFKDNYLRPDGTAYSAVVKNLQDTTALGYTYDQLPAAHDNVAFDAERSKRLHALFAGVGEQVENLQLLAPVNRLAATPAKPLVKEASLPGAGAKLLAAKVPEGQHGPEVFALVRNVVVSPSVESIRVFVNAPHVTAATPDTDPHFVDQIGIFQHIDKGPHHKAPLSALVDLTPALRNLEKAGLLEGDTISVVLLPVVRKGAALASATAVPASVEIGVL
jgi:tyrosinase